MYETMRRNATRCNVALWPGRCAASFFRGRSSVDPKSSFPSSTVEFCLECPGVLPPVDATVGAKASSAAHAPSHMRNASPSNFVSVEQSSVTSGRSDQRLSPQGAATSAPVQLPETTSPASSEGGGGRVRSTSPSNRSARSVRRHAGASSWFLSPAAATTAAVVSTTPHPPSVLSTAWVCNARKSRSANDRSSSFTLPVSTGMSQRCHPACPSTACAFPAAPSTSERINSNTPARISLSSHVSKSRRRRPAADACTMPGTPEVEDPGSGSSVIPFDSCTVLDDALDTDPKNRPAAYLAAAFADATDTPPKDPLDFEVDLEPLAKPSGAASAGTGWPPSMSSNSAARMSWVSGKRTSASPTADISPGGAICDLTSESSAPAAAATSLDRGISAVSRRMDTALVCACVRVSGARTTAPPQHSFTIAPASQVPSGDPGWSMSTKASRMSAAAAPAASDSPASSTAENAD